MSNPVLVEVFRGGVLESQHRGSVAIVDADGHLHTRVGDVARPVFPRSAIKAIQALPLVESGAADAFGFQQKELALVCASHSAEQQHLDLARRMLSAAGCDETCLECGGHWASRQPGLLAQARQYDTTPPAICNNCSGKHTGFICTAVHCGIETRGYTDAEHEVQRNVRAALEDVTGAPHQQWCRGTDGCSIPTYAVPLQSLALGFARMVTGVGLSAQRARAAKRLTQACMAEPFYVAGSGRFCTDVMGAGNSTVFVKTGAEGVFCGAIPSLGLGIALKCDDGAVRGAESMMAAILSALLPENAELQDELSGHSAVNLANCNNYSVGEIRSCIDAYLPRI
ncbi:MAG: asparaginase [Burkholderiaceae bacterium]